MREDVAPSGCGAVPETGMPLPANGSSSGLEGEPSPVLQGSFVILALARSLMGRGAAGSTVRCTQVAFGAVVLPAAKEMEALTGKGAQASWAL